MRVSGKGLKDLDLYFQQTLLDILMQAYSSDHTLRNTVLRDSLDFNGILTGGDYTDRRKTLKEMARVGKYAGTQKTAHLAGHQE